MQRFRGLKNLVHEAVDLTTELVRDGHESSARSVLRVVGRIEPLAETARVVDGLRRVGTDRVLGTIRTVNHALRDWSDVALDGVEMLKSQHAVSQQAERSPAERPQAERPQAAEPSEDTLPLRSDAIGSWPWLVDGALGLLNGSIGDHLHGRDNGLGMRMQLRYGARYLPEDPERCRGLLKGATSKVAVFVHGLGATEWSWCFEGAAYHGDPEASFASLLERDLGYTPLLVRYNTGRHVSENGRLLALHLQRVFEAWPMPVEEIVLIGHSMGGLVVRSACHYASEQRCSAEATEPAGRLEQSTQGASWAEKVRHVFCLGAPHRGAPLEKLGAMATALLGAIDVPGTQIPARLARARSAGIKDMRTGCLVDEDWLGRDPDALGDVPLTSVPLLPWARYYFVSATLTRDPNHLLGRLIGDLVVLAPSALGPTCEEHTFPIETRLYGGVLHHQLQNHPALYAQIREALGGSRSSMSPCAE